MSLSKTLSLLLLHLSMNYFHSSFPCWSLHSDRKSSAQAWNISPFASGPYNFFLLYFSFPFSCIRSFIAPGSLKLIQKGATGKSKVRHFSSFCPADERIQVSLISAQHRTPWRHQRLWLADLLYNPDLWLWALLCDLVLLSQQHFVCVLMCAWQQMVEAVLPQADRQGRGTGLCWLQQTQHLSLFYPVGLSLCLSLPMSSSPRLSVRRMNGWLSLSVSSHTTFSSSVSLFVLSFLWKNVRLVYHTLHPSIHPPLCLSDEYLSFFWPPPPSQSIPLSLPSLCEFVRRLCGTVYLNCEPTCTVYVCLCVFQ